MLIIFGMSNIRSSRNGSSTDDKRLWTTTTSRSKKMQCPAENRRPFQRECRGRVQQLTPVVAHVIRPLHIFFYFVFAHLSYYHFGSRDRWGGSNEFRVFSLWHIFLAKRFFLSLCIIVYMFVPCVDFWWLVSNIIFYTKIFWLAVVVCFDPPCYFL